MLFNFIYKKKELLFLVLLFFSTLALGANKLVKPPISFGQNRGRSNGNLQLKQKRGGGDFACEQFSRDYEFIFFYSDSCKYCRTFAPILKRYSALSKIEVAGVFIGDGSPKNNSSLQNMFRGNVIPEEMVEQFFGKGKSVSVPTLFILNKNNLHVYPVSSGALTYLELDKRMEELKPRILFNEKKNLTTSIKRHIRDSNYINGGRNV